MKKKGKANIPKTNPITESQFGGEYREGSSKGIPTPRRKGFGHPGAATKDGKHGVGAKRSK